MTRATLTKLLILVILVFIICLPEFFILSRVSKVNFLCLPYPSCQRGDTAAGENGGRGGSETKGKPECSSWQTAEWQKGKELCTQENQVSLNPLSDSRVWGDSDKNWFMCETDLDMAELQQNLSSSALRLLFEVSVELQLRDTEDLNLTLYGLGNHSSLQPHPPEEEDGAGGERAKEDNGKGQAFYCCLPTSDPAAQSHCLLWLANQTFMTATQRPPSRVTSKGEWRCALRVLWLVLLCVVLLAILSTVLEQIFIYKKAKVHPACCEVTFKQSKGRILDFNVTQPWAVSINGTELPPIQEAQSQDDIETLLDGTIDHSSTACLHHRSHHATATDTDGMHIL